MHGRARLASRIGVLPSSLAYRMDTESGRRIANLTTRNPPMPMETATSIMKDTKSPTVHVPDDRHRPFIVGIGGTTRSDSSTERALQITLRAAEAAGATTVLFAAKALSLPAYVPERSARTPEAVQLVEAIRRADGIIIASPGYHGCVSGLVKNALDYAEDLRDDRRTYFEGRAVGCIVTASGWQATVSTLHALRSISHALRGWPTPLGVSINTSDPVFAPDGRCLSNRIQEQLETLARHVVGFARLQLESAGEALASANPRNEP